MEESAAKSAARSTIARVLQDGLVASAAKVRMLKLVPCLSCALSDCLLLKQDKLTHLNSVRTYYHMFASDLDNLTKIANRRVSFSVKIIIEKLGFLNAPISNSSDRFIVNKTDKVNVPTFRPNMFVYLDFVVKYLGGNSNICC